MQSSATIVNLSKALVAAQTEIKSVSFDAKNEFFHNKYATLGAVIDTVKPVFAKYKLAIVQFPTSDSQGVGIDTVLLHESGEWMSQTITLPWDSIKGLSPAQLAGVYISYLRRYSMASVAALYSDEDNDGEVGNREDQPKPAVQPKPQAQQPIPQQVDDSVPVCPKCSGDMWDNRKDKINPKAPDFKCKNKECGGAIWPEKTAEQEWAEIMAIPRTQGQHWADNPEIRKRIWIVIKKLGMSNTEAHDALGVEHFNETECSLEEAGSMLFAYRDMRNEQERR